ncbi:hypothetical protein [Actinomadura napierensis]|uniref:hypothetical protein n=1 Tax=Actinomadura napierensis TaxID=267854 RepID=UPI0031E16D47
MPTSSAGPVRGTFSMPWKTGEVYARHGSRARFAARISVADGGVQSRGEGMAPIVWEADRHS